MSNLNEKFTSVSELLERLRGNNRESANASVTRPNNEIMSNMSSYHQSFEFLRGKIK